MDTVKPICLRICHSRLFGTNTLERQPWTSGVSTFCLRKWMYI